MKKFIKKFESAIAADGFNIVDIPFTTSVEPSSTYPSINHMLNLVCNRTNKHLENDNGTVIICPPDVIFFYKTSDNRKIENTFTNKAEIHEWDPVNKQWVLIFTNGITNIDENAFLSEDTLVSMVIPNNIISIEDYAFYNCSGLTSVTIPNSVTSIGEQAFYECSDLTSVTIPNSVTSIGKEAFSYCSGLTSVTIGNGLTNIEESTFFNCTGLTFVSIGNSVTSIKKDAFFGCSGLTSIEIPNSVTSIGGSAFQYCSNLTSVTIPNSVTSIGSYAFECSNNTFLHFESTTPINLVDKNNNIIYMCGDPGYHGICVGGIYVPTGYEADYAEHDDGWDLLSLYVVNYEPPVYNAEIRYKTHSGDKIENTFTNQADYHKYDHNEDEWVLRFLNTTYIDRGAFANNTDLHEIEIVKGVTSIENDAFYRCSGLRSIAIPSSVTSIGESALACSQYTDITFDSTIPIDLVDEYDNIIRMCGYNEYDKIVDKIYVPSGTIFDYAEHDAGWDLLKENINGYYAPSHIIKYTTTDDSKIENDFTNVYHPVQQYNSSSHEWTMRFKQHQTIDLTAYNSLFEHNTKLKSVEFINGTNKFTIGSSCFEGCTNLISATIDDSIASIEYAAFEGCSSLTTVNITGNSINSIPQHAFNGCRSLTSVTIPNSVISIGDYAFAYCSSLTSLTIPNRVTNIGSDAFYGCTHLTSITIPNSVTNIGNRAFYGCNSLTSVVWNAKNCSNSGNFGSQVTSFTFGEEVEVIPASICAGMTNLTSITIPNSVTSIGGSAFYNCTGLISVNISNNVTSIGDEAFACSSNTDLYFNSMTPIDLVDSNDNIIYMCGGKQSTPIKIGNIYVPTADYATHDRGWEYLIGHIVAPTRKTVFHYDDGTTSESDDATITSASYDSEKTLTSVEFGDAVTSIGNGAFEDCSDLTSIEIPDRVTSIGNRAFRYCYNLTSLMIGNSVTSIGEEAFYGCSSLTSVTIPNSVRSINSDAFHDCSNLRYIEIPSSVTSIGSNALALTGWNSFVVKFISSTPISLIDDQGNIIHAFGTLGDVSGASDVTIQVPSSAVNTYKAAWEYYASCIVGY